jgi:hypothetical protein
VKAKSSLASSEEASPLLSEGETSEEGVAETTLETSEEDLVGNKSPELSDVYFDVEDNAHSSSLVYLSSDLPRSILREIYKTTLETSVVFTDSLHSEDTSKVILYIFPARQPSSLVLSDVSEFNKLLRNAELRGYACGRCPGRVVFLDLETTLETSVVDPHVRVITSVEALKREVVTRVRRAQTFTRFECSLRPL